MIVNIRRTPDSKYAPAVISPVLFSRNPTSVKVSIMVSSLSQDI